MRFLFLLLASITCVNCATIQETFSEIKAIATARVQFNESWVRYLNEGRFNPEDTENASLEERARHCIENFSKHYIDTSSIPVNESKLSLTLKNQCEPFERDISCYNNIIACIDQCRGSDESVNCLYGYLHCLFCYKDPELDKPNKELTDRFWILSILRKLEPYVSSSVKFIEDLFHRRNNECIVTVEKLPRERTSLRQLQLDLHSRMAHRKPKIHSQYHTSDCVDAFKKNIQLDFKNIGRGNALNTFVDDTYPWFMVSSSVGMSKGCVSDYEQFSNIFDSSLSPFLRKMEVAWQAGEEWRKIIKGVELVINNYEVDCCDKWREHAKPQTPLTRKQRLAQKIEEKPLIGKQEEEPLPPVAKTEKQEVAGGCSTDQIIPQEETVTLSADPEKDLLSFELMPSASDEEVDVLNEAECETIVEPAEDKQPEQLSVLQYKSACMINDTKGPVNYAKFMKQLQRDFKDNIWRRPDENKNSRLVKLVFPLSTDINLCACAMYDSPHGSQLSKAWPQWRYAFKNMFLSLEGQMSESLK